MFFFCGYAQDRTAYGGRFFRYIVIEVNKDVAAKSLKLPASARSITVKGNNGSKITLYGVSSIAPKYDLRFSDITIESLNSSGKSNASFKINSKAGVSLSNVTFLGSALTLKGKDTLEMGDLKGILSSATGFDRININGSVTVGKTLKTPNLFIGAAGKLSVDAKASVKATKSYEGAAGSEIIFVNGFKPIALPDVISGKTTLRHYTAFTPNETLFTIKKLTLTQIRTVFDVPEGHYLDLNKKKVVIKKS